MFLGIQSLIYTLTSWTHQSISSNTLRTYPRQILNVWITCSLHVVKSISATSGSHYSASWKSVSEFIWILAHVFSVFCLLYKLLLPFLYTISCLFLLKTFFFFQIGFSCFCGKDDFSKCFCSKLCCSVNCEISVNLINKIWN